MVDRNGSRVLFAVLLSCAAGGAVAQEAEAPAEPAPALEQPADLDLGPSPAAEEPAAPAPAPEPQEEAAAPQEPAPIEAPEDAAELETPAEESAAGDEVDWAGLAERFPEFFAVTHHAAVHLPIALWLFGALFVVIGLIVPSWRTQIPLACLIGGMLSSIPAVASGWWYAEFTYGDDWREVDWGEALVQHRWGAVALLVTSLVLSVLALVNLRKRSVGLGFVWRVGLIVLAVAVGWVGHVGGELVVGEGFFEEALEAWINPDGE